MPLYTSLFNMTLIQYISYYFVLGRHLAIQLCYITYRSKCGCT